MPIPVEIAGENRLMRSSAESRADFLRRNPGVAERYPAEVWTDDGRPIGYWRRPAESFAAARRPGGGE